MTYLFVSREQIKKEKTKVRIAKKSRWWHEKCAGGLCYYCGKQFSPQELTLDHIVPIARGGKTTPGNVVAACRACNKEKGVDTPVDIFFKKHLSE